MQRRTTVCGVRWYRSTYLIYSPSGDLRESRVKDPIGHYCLLQEDGKYPIGQLASPDNVEASDDPGLAKHQEPPAFSFNIVAGPDVSI